MKARIACIALLAVLLGVPDAYSITFSEVYVNPGLVMVFTTDPAAAPSPIVVTIGVSVPMEISSLFFIETGLDIFGVNYRYTDTRAVPATIEHADGFFTPSFLIGVQAGIRYPLTETLVIGGTAGADILIRFPLELVNDSSESIADRDPAMEYFYGSLRFLYPETRIFLRWQAVEQLGLVFSVRALYPVFHLWDGENLPFLDQLMLAGSLGFAIKL
jgi:hypothetical protein